MSKVIKYILLFFFVCYLGLQLWFYVNAVSEGEQAPEIKAQLIDGSSFQLSKLKGDYVLLDFWASWCGPCRADSPKKVALYNKYKHASFNDADKFHVVSIALEKEGDAWKRFAANAGFNWPFQIVEKHAVVMMSSIAQSYGVNEIPSKFLVLPDGTIHSATSFEEMDLFLANRIK